LLPGFSHLLAEHAREQIGAAARRLRSNDAYWFRRVTLRACSDGARGYEDRNRASPKTRRQRWNQVLEYRFLKMGPASMLNDRQS